MTTQDSSFGVTGAVVGTAAALVGGAAVYYLWRQSQKTLEYRPVGKVSRLFLYPIKSCRGIAVDKVQCNKLGFVSEGFRDREFLIVDGKNHFITARQEPSMVLITPSLHPGELWLDAPGMETIKIKKPKDEDSRRLTCRIWGEDAEALDCGNEVSQWLCKYFGQTNLKLVHFYKTESKRQPAMWKHFELFRKTDNSIFSDLTAYMMLGEASVDELNSRLINKITIKNFRPNIGVTGSNAFDEETWKHIKIGNVTYRNVKPCTRCIFTTIDPETGVKDGVEPLKTLKSYKQHKEERLRKVDGDSPIFGVHLSADKFGTISVGDEIFAAL